MVPVTAIMDTISLRFSAMDNYLLHESELSPAYKIEERITFVLSHARLYLSESDDEYDNKSAFENTIGISFGGVGSSSSL